MNKDLVDVVISLNKILKKRTRRERISKTCREK